MNDFLSFNINYELIRKPNRKTNNIFAYAAKVDISVNNKVYLSVDDLAICDFINQIEQWLNNLETDFIFIPQDSTEIVLKFVKNGDNYQITSQWTNKSGKVNATALTNYLLDFVDKVKKECKLYKGYYD